MNACYNQPTCHLSEAKWMVILLLLILTTLPPSPRSCFLQKAKCICVVFLWYIRIHTFVFSLAVRPEVRRINETKRFLNEFCCNFLTFHCQLHSCMYHCNTIRSMLINSHCSFENFNHPSDLGSVFLCGEHFKKRWRLCD